MKYLTTFSKQPFEFKFYRPTGPVKYYGNGGTIEGRSYFMYD